MKRGLTLIEVLVALAVFALAAVGLAATHGNLLLARESMQRLEREDEALREARAAVLAPDALADGQLVTLSGQALSGTLQLEDGSDASWEAELALTDVSDLFAVKLTVRSINGTRETLTQQAFFLLRPAWSSDADRQTRRQAARERLRASRAFEGTLGGNASGNTNRRSRPQTLPAEGGTQRPNNARPTDAGRPERSGR